MHKDSAKELVTRKEGGSSGVGVWQHASEAGSLQAANGLVRSGQARVCLLHGGIEALRTAGLLELPPRVTQ